MKSALRRALVALLTIGLALGLYKLVLLRREAFFRQQLDALGRWPYAHFPTEAARTLLRAKEGPGRILREAQQRPAHWREGAVRSLRGTRHSSALPVLITFSRNDPSPEVRALAVAGLWPCARGGSQEEQQAALAALVDGLSDPEPPVFGAAMAQLGGCRHGVEALIRALEDARPLVRRRAAATLRDGWYDASLCERLADWLAKAEDEYVREQLARALGTNRDGYPYLKAYLNDANRLVRREAQRAVTRWEGGVPK